MARGLNWTEDELEGYWERRGRPRKKARPAPKASPAAATPEQRMNKLESQYAEHLDLRKRAGEIARWQFEALKLRLAKRTWYTPDFLVQLPDGTLEIHETKGFWRDDARVKWKVAAEQFPMFVFRALRLEAGEWIEEVAG